MFGKDKVSEAAVLEALRAVQDPDLHRDIVSLGFVKELKIDGGNVSFKVELTTPACPVKDRLKAESEEAVRRVPGVKAVAVEMTASVRGARPLSRDAILPGVKN